MKLKAIFILFNVVIVGSFLVIFFMPFFVLGSDFSRMFWSDNWYLSILFVLVLAALNIFFARNWKLFGILDREAWPELKEYLEKEIFERGRVTNQFIRLYVQSALITGKIMDIRKLEAKVREKREHLIEKHVLAFGLPYMVAQDAAAMESFYGAYTGSKGADRYWIRWCLAFAMMLSGKIDEAEEELSFIFKTSREGILRLLSLYLISGCGGGRSGSIVEEGKKELRASMSSSDFDTEKRKKSDNYLILVLSRLIQDAKLWLYPGEEVE